MPRPKIYQGLRHKDGTIQVTVDGTPLPPRPLHPGNEGRFNWGCGYSGSTNLARAILADYFEDEGYGHDKEGQELCQMFAFRIVEPLPHWGWTLSGDDVDIGVTRLRLEPWWRPVTD